MIKKLSPTQKKISKNSIALFILQGASYLLPLLTVPYLVQVLGLEYFGLLAFATAFTMYFVVLTDYGFNLSATNKIALNKGNILEINEIFTSVLFIKFILVILGFFLMVFVVLLMPIYQDFLNVFIYTYGMVLGQALTPLWLFQGLERMKYMTYFNVLAKLIGTFSIFTFIQEPDDYFLVPILISLGFILAGFSSLYLAFKEFGMRLYLPSINKILLELKDGWHIFINNFFVNLYSTTNIVLLGLLTNNTVVGYYSLAEKIIGAISGLFTPVTQAMYPYLSLLYSKDKMKFDFLFKKTYLIYILISTILAILLFMYRLEVTFLLTSENNIYISNILAILVFPLALSPLGSLFTQAFIIKSQTNRFMKVVKYTLYVNMLLVFFLIHFYGVIGLAYTVLIRQIAHTMLNFKYYSRS